MRWSGTFLGRDSQLALRSALIRKETAQCTELLFVFLLDVLSEARNLLAYSTVFLEMASKTVASAKPEILIMAPAETAVQVFSACGMLRFFSKIKLDTAAQHTSKLQESSPRLLAHLLLISAERLNTSPALKPRIATEGQEAPLRKCSECPADLA